MHVLASPPAARRPPLIARPAALASAARFKVEPKKQWPKLKVPIPEPACSSPSAMLAYLRTAPDVPGFLKFALGHKKATVATEAPFAEKSHVVALSDGRFLRHTGPPVGVCDRGDNVMPTLAERAGVGGGARWLFFLGCFSSC